ncbi:MAG: acyl-CoA dehydrogenase [Acidobacteriota bacterium]
MDQEQIRRLLVETASRLFADGPENEVQEGVEQSRFPQELWDAIEDNGLGDALLPESAGGSGFDYPNALAPLRVAGAFALPVPLMETMVGRRLLHDVGISAPEGPLGLVFVDTCPTVRCTRNGSLLSLDGRLRVAWANDIDSLVVVKATSMEALVGRMKLKRGGDGGFNMAGEPCRDLELNDVTIDGHESNLWRHERPLWLGAAARTQMIAGALDRVLDLSIEHAQGREQFGRAIAKFQAVQHLVAQMASEVAAVGVAAESAAHALTRHDGGLEVAAAKARASEAAENVARLAHQVHAAIGYTREHVLHRFTRRLWLWRDAEGDELFWQERVGRAVLAGGGDEVWPLLSRN